MDIIKNLTPRWNEIDYPFLIHANGELRFSEITDQKSVDLFESKAVTLWH
jgi:hypothetical protein|tara:strand:- start:317 stop:466 length:150 start_codon:yes stop_codon:yes gene_type:complete